MFPIADENIGRRITPVVTWALIGLNVLVFIYQLSLGMAAMGAFFATWGVQPYEIIRLRDLPALMTSMFIHGGLGHLFSNMIFLHVFGDNLEDVMGHLRYLVFYLICGFAATFAQIAIDPSSQIPMIGASGAISGILGGYLVLFPTGRVKAIVFLVVMMVPAWIMLGLWFGLQAFSAWGALGREGGGVAFMAHVGGFIAGVVLARLFADSGELARQRRIRAEHRRMEALRRGRA
jgi:membrane associated rhomboid family serine protease